jgi:hypothetical protein
MEFDLNIRDIGITLDHTNLDEFHLTTFGVDPIPDFIEISSVLSDMKRAD